MLSNILTVPRHKPPAHSSAAFVVYGLISLFVPALGHTQATSPITSSGLNTTVTTSGNVHEITGGTRPSSGPNLFHSFGEFGVPTNHVANFLNDSGLATSNILGRVTGGNPSNIFGTIQTTGFGSANLFLMNPAGIVFGPNASLNVGGSVSFTTADYLRFTDGARFNAVPSLQDAAISSAPVAAFGFLGSNPGAITLQGGQLAVSEGHGMSLVGGNIEITAGTATNGAVQPARLTAPGGQINLVSVASAGEVLTGGTAGPILNSFSAMGTMSLAQGAVIDTSAPSAGRIIIRSGQFTMENAHLEASTTFTVPDASLSPAAAAEGISIQADHAALSQGATILASSIDRTAGNINMEVGSLRSNVGADGTSLSGAPPVTIASASTGHGGAGSISITGAAGGPAHEVLLSNTHIVTGVTNAANPRVAPGNIAITAQQVELTNGTLLRSDTTGGADAGAITLNLDTLKTQAGPDGRVLISADSNCGSQCLGGQAADITIQGMPGVTPPTTRIYRHVTTPDAEPNRPITYYFAKEFDFKGTDIHSDAYANAPGGKVIMRTNGPASFSDSAVSVATQDFEINGLKPNGEPANNQGFSRIDIMAHDIVLKDSTIKADADVSDIGSCPFCQGGPSAGEIWLRVERSLTADNSLIANRSRGRAQAGITKIIKDHYFSFGAVWDTLYPDAPAESVRLTNSEVTVESQHEGLPGYLRIRADNISLDHSIVNSKVNNVTNVLDSQGQLIDVAGAGEAGITVTDGRSVQGSLYMSAKVLDITGGGIIAPTQGSRIANRIELHADQLITHPGTRPAGTLASPMVLDGTDPTRVVISSNSTGSGGAGLVSITGVSVPIADGVPHPPSASIILNRTDVLTETNSVGIGGKIEMRATGPIELRDSTVSANVTDVRPNVANIQAETGNIAISGGSISMQGGEISALSRGTRVGGDIAINAGQSLSLNNGASVSASSIGLGDAGNITINAGPQFLGQNSSITTEAAQASGGNIFIQATDSIRLVNSKLSTSVQGGPNTSGGNITLDPAVVTLQNSQVLAQAVQGAGGNISIIAGTFLADPTSVVSASSQFGLSGAVNIQSPLSSLSNTLATLPQRPLQAQPLLTQHCAAQANGHLSSLVVSGRDSLPMEPGGWLMSPMALMAGDVPTPQAHLADIELSQQIQGHSRQWSDQRGSSSQRVVFDRTTGCRS